MSRFFWNPAATAPALHTLLENLAPYCTGLAAGTGEVELKLELLPGAGVRVHRDGATVRITAGSLSRAARGVALALAGIDADENTPFTMLGIMLDCSRNKVFRPEYLREYLARLALLGHNTLMLYTEDTYQLEGEPFFGFMRGGYSIAELRELDAYARTLGIELIGCIQMLGHMEQLLKWSAAATTVTDTARVLLVDEPATYALLDKMAAFWAAALQTRRLHIGFDETHDLGRGRFMDKFGYERGFDIFNRHLKAVNALCARHGFAEPTIWGDMYFRMASPSRQTYYFDNPDIPADVKAQIPANIQLCYWDYYHAEFDFYDRYIQYHQTLGKNTMMGSGVWTWAKLWYDHEKTVNTATPCVKACRANNLRELIFTMWGDDGGYCLYDSALAGLAYVADLAFGAEENDVEHTAKLYHAATGKDYRRCLEVSRMESELQKGTLETYFPSQMLWDDPLECVALRSCGAGFAVKMTQAAQTALTAATHGEDSLEYRTIAAAARFIIAKLAAVTALREAYLRNDRVVLARLAEREFPELVALNEAYDALYRQAWLREARHAGLSTLQVRNAGQRARLTEAATRIREYLSGAIDTIDELATPDDGKAFYVGPVYNRYASGTSIK